MSIAEKIGDLLTLEETLELLEMLDKEGSKNFFDPIDADFNQEKLNSCVEGILNMMKKIATEMISQQETTLGEVVSQFFGKNINYVPNQYPEEYERLKKIFGRLI